MVDDVETKEEIRPFLPKLLWVISTAIESTLGQAASLPQLSTMPTAPPWLILTLNFVKYNYMNNKSIVFFSCRSPNVSVTEKVYLVLKELGFYYLLPGTLPERVTSSGGKDPPGYYLLEALSTWQGLVGKE